MSMIETDILFVGSGLGASAAARTLARSGYRVVLVPGIGSTRSPDIDGGVVDPRLVAAAYGPGAPLGEPVAACASIALSSDGAFEVSKAVPLPSPLRYHRSTLERWAMDHAVAAGAVFLDDLIEGIVLPDGDDVAVLTSERDDREIRVRVIVLTEGADPRIALRVGLRPDYGPEDQLHFARVRVSGITVDRVRRGFWRTSWGMPVEVALVPQADATLVSVVARIENVMRASRSSKDALRNLMSSPAFASLQVDGEPGDTGMELVALRRDHRALAFVHDRLLMGVDFSGVIDPRSLDRANLTIRAGQHLGAYLVENDLRLDDWTTTANAFVRDAIPQPRAYHEDKMTGFLEEGPAASGQVVGRIAGWLRRGRRTVERTG